VGGGTDRQTGRHKQGERQTDDVHYRQTVFETVTRRVFVPCQEPVLRSSITEFAEAHLVAADQPRNDQTAEETKDECLQGLSLGRSNAAHRKSQTVEKGEEKERQRGTETHTEREREREREREPNLPKSLQEL
jgi:hypothetical protein